MFKLFPIAFRNIGRNRRRTTLTLAAVVFGVTASLFLHAFAGGLIAMLLGRIVNGRVGAIQVHKVGFLAAEQDPLDFDLPFDETVLAKLRATKGVVAVAPRITFQGMLSNGTSQSLAEVTAVDPVGEPLVCPGRWADAKAKPIGTSTAGAGNIGRALAEGLGVTPGGSLTLLATSKFGTPNVLDFLVNDVSGSTNPLDSKRAITVPLAYAQELLRMPGRVTELALGVEKLDDVEAVAVRVRAVLGPDYEVSTWGDVLPQIRDGLATLTAALSFVTLILGLLVATGIANTMLMSVFERVREVGTMLAVGVKRHVIVTLFITESAFIGLVGALIGATLGSALVTTLGRVGIPFKPPGADVPALVRPFIGAGFVGLVAVLAVLFAILAAIYPAWRAAKLSPVDALRSN